jgi:hypothetical protein
MIEPHSARQIATSPGRDHLGRDRNISVAGIGHCGDSGIRDARSAALANSQTSFPLTAAAAAHHA